LITYLLFIHILEFRVHYTHLDGGYEEYEKNTYRKYNYYK
jgi:hypothetical protein